MRVGLKPIKIKNKYNLEKELSYFYHISTTLFLRVSVIK